MIFIPEAFSSLPPPGIPTGESGGLDIAFLYQIGQAVMRLSQTKPQMSGKIALGKVAG
jgi:hypothetical protein